MTAQKPRDKYLQTPSGALLPSLLLAISLLVATVRGAVPIHESAIAWWPGEGDASDLLNAHPGAFEGQAAYGPGLVGEAFRFEGGLSRVVVPDSHEFALKTSITVEAWIKPFGHQGTLDPVIKKSSPDQKHGFALEFGGIGGRQILFWVNFDTNGWKSAPGPTIPDNEWTHVAGSYDGQTIRIFVNGEEVGSTVVGGDMSPSTASLMIGADPSNAGRHFRGLIDEASIYSEALPAEVIHAIFQAGASGKEAAFRVMVPPVIVGHTNAPLEVIFKASGGIPPYRWSVTDGILPGGVTLTEGGVLKGTPEAAGEYRWRLTATDSANSTASAYAVMRVPLPLIPLAVPDGIAGWWPFEDASASQEVLDRIGSHPGSSVGNPQKVPGKVGNALLLNGRDQYVSYQNTGPFLLGSSPFTIEMWARFDTPGGGSVGEPSHVLMGSSDGPGQQHKWMFALGGGVLEFIGHGPAGCLSHPWGVRALTWKVVPLRMGA